jgi:hypothetical protein
VDFFPDAACLTFLARMATGFNDMQEATLLPRNGGTARVLHSQRSVRHGFICEILRATRLTPRTGWNKLVPACTAALSDGMEIETDIRSSTQVGAHLLDVSPDDAKQLDVHDKDVRSTKVTAVRIEHHKSRAVRSREDGSRTGPP